MVLTLSDSDSLQANLSEIYSALHANKHAPTPDKLSLYAIDNSTLYYQGTFLGRVIIILRKFWCMIRSIKSPETVEKVLSFVLTTLFDHAVHQAYDSRQQRIWNQMRQIDHVYPNTNTTGQRDRYADFLKKELQGSVEENHRMSYLTDFDNRKTTLLTLNEEGHLRQRIIKIFQAISVFWSLFMKNTQEAISLRAPLMPMVHSHSTLTDPVLFCALKKEFKWAQMEGVTQQSIPIAILAKLDHPEQLSVTEKKRLNLWVEALNRCQHLISPRLLFSVLTEILSVIQIQGSSSLTMQDLLVWLDQQQCEIMRQEDTMHMDWRERLKPGDTVLCNGFKLILGQQISPDKFVNDTYKVFELTNYPGGVLKIADNRFRLLIEDKEARESWGVRLVETISNLTGSDQNIVHGLDQEGRCVVLEKLSDAFDCHPWQSQEEQLTPEDERYAIVLANHLYCMIRWNASPKNLWNGSPKNLAPGHLMWDEKGRLKSTRLFKEGSFNYNDLEEYCIIIARNNPYVLQFLMRVSKLKEHKIAAFYQAVIEQTLQKGKINLIGHPLPLGYREECYERHIQELCEQAKELRARCFKRVIAYMTKTNQYSLEKKAKVEQYVIKKMIEAYRAWTPGSLAGLEDRVVDSCLITSSPKPEAPFNASTYYQEKHALMMQNNEAAYIA